MTDAHIPPTVSRRGVVAGTAAVATGLAGAPGRAEPIERRNPIIGHAIATIGVPEVAAAQAMYEKAIGLEEVAKGSVGEGLARSWGAPGMQGAPWVMLRCASGDPSFHVRLVQVDPVPGYRAMATWGLNAIEMISSDVYAVNERLLGAGFQVIGEPRPLSEAYASVPECLSIVYIQSPPALVERHSVGVSLAVLIVQECSNVKTERCACRDFVFAK